MNDNFQQLLQMKAEDDPNLAEWLRRKENVYTSPAIQNEIIKVMGLQVLKRSDLQSSSFLTVMADETTDSSNREQVTLILRRVTKELEVHHGSSVLGCFLDASKAFDLVDHGILFNTLLERGLPLSIVRFSISWYSMQQLRVRLSLILCGRVVFWIVCWLI